MKIFSSIAIMGVIAAVLVASGVFYTINETEQVIITQMGKPVGKPVIKPGLHMKLPFIQQANYFDKRFLAWDGNPNQIPTKDKRFIWVDTYARWRIADPLLFFQRLRDQYQAQSRLSDILDGGTRNVVARHLLIELVRSKNFEKEAMASDSKEMNTPIKFGRQALAEEVLKNASKRAAPLGIDILDFKFKRINYVEQVRKEVYARMISERMRIAEQYRSEGAGEAARIEGEMERQLKVISSQAYRKSQDIKGRADANATEIYASAYNRSPEFYSFMRTLESYKKTLNKDTTLILSTDSLFMKYIEDIK